MQEHCNFRFKADVDLRESDF